MDFTDALLEQFEVLYGASGGMHTDFLTQMVCNDLDFEGDAARPVGTLLAKSEVLLVALSSVNMGYVPISTSRRVYSRRHLSCAPLSLS